MPLPLMNEGTPQVRADYYGVALANITEALLPPTGQPGRTVEDDNNWRSTYLTQCSAVPESSSGMPGHTHTHTLLHYHPLYSTLSLDCGLKV